MYPVPPTPPAWDPLTQPSDAIVVGTGPGGATVGHQLAAAGLRVLFCERGGDAAGRPELLGQYPELAEGRAGAVPHAGRDAALLARAGRCADTVVDAEHPRRHAFVPFIGSGPGGSSALYGMALERLLPRDFEPGDPPADAAGSSAVGRWPVSYAEMAPYYARAERLYRVRGERDPLAGLDGTLPADQQPQLLEPLPLSAAMDELAGFFTRCGLHPYRLPLACDALPDCRSCQGVLCHRPCKNDAARIGLRPAIEQHDAQLLTGCRVLQVLSEGRAVRGVRVQWRGQQHTLRAPLVVLAAGALQTPLILLRSESPGGRGLGNGSDQVGRHLMRHFVDLMQFKPAREDDAGFDNRRKEIAFNDFYVDSGARLGTVQSFGRLPPADMLFGSLVDDVRASPFSPLAGLLPLARPFLQPVLRGIEGAHLTLASIVEDLPYPEHRVAPDGDDVTRARLHYTMKPEALRRVQLMRQRLKDSWRGRAFKLLPQAANNQRIAHVCGTCRFGDDPRSSVLDRDNRVHEADGLFVTDASFMPGSGGTNPTLTIVANALRVADRILAAR